MGRREELAGAATDYALEHGLVGLRLRPLAAALGTSDRMLLYHFRDKDDLVTEVLRESTARSVAALQALPPSPGPAQAVLDLWRVVASPAQSRCQRLYVEAAALGVLAIAPYAAVVRDANDAWLGALSDHLAASGLPAEVAHRAARLVEAAFMGLQLDEAVERPEVIEATVQDLADSVAGLGWNGA